MTAYSTGYARDKFFLAMVVDGHRAGAEAAELRLVYCDPVMGDK